MESAEFTNEALSELQVRPVERSEERRYQEQMGGSVAKFLKGRAGIGDDGSV